MSEEVEHVGFEAPGLKIDVEYCRLVAEGFQELGQGQEPGQPVPKGGEAGLANPNPSTVDRHRLIVK